MYITQYWSKHIISRTHTLSKNIQVGALRRVVLVYNHTRTVESLGRLRNLIKSNDFEKSLCFIHFLDDKKGNVTLSMKSWNYINSRIFINCIWLQKHMNFLCICFVFRASICRTVRYILRMIHHKMEKDFTFVRAFRDMFYYM